jgi:NAD(P)H-nitrite reductase large subunit
MDAGANRLRVLLGDDRVVGAIVMGDQTLSRPLQRVIRERVDIRAVRERWIQRPAEVHQILQTLAERAVPLGAV